MKFLNEQTGKTEVPYIKKYIIMSFENELKEVYGWCIRLPNDSCPTLKMRCNPLESG